MSRSFLRNSNKSPCERLCKGFAIQRFLLLLPIKIPLLMFFNRFTAFICGIVISLTAIAQVKLDKLKFGDIRPEDFKSDHYEIDSSADAVYLYNMASARYDVNTGLTINYKVHRRIRLLRKNSFADLGTVKIPLYQFGYTEDRLQNLQAAT